MDSKDDKLYINSLNLIDQLNVIDMLGHVSLISGLNYKKIYMFDVIWGIKSAKVDAY